MLLNKKEKRTIETDKQIQEVFKEIKSLKEIKKMKKQGFVFEKLANGETIFYKPKKVAK